MPLPKAYVQLLEGIVSLHRQGSVVEFPFDALLARYAKRALEDLVKVC